MEDFIGGGELNDNEALNLLESKGYNLKKMRSYDVSVEFIKNNLNSFYIISNFTGVKPAALSLLENSCRYLIYEHDHKYVKNRNPGIYDNYIAPRAELINVSFYENAVRVLCQSGLHQEIIQKNLHLTNLKNVSGNLWSPLNLDLLSKLSQAEKINRISIIDSDITHKNTAEAEFYCKKRNFNYDKIKSKNYEEFLTLLSRNNKFLFLPKTPETLSRVVVEAKMLNVQVMTTKNVGAVHEPWYKLNGDLLIEEMRNCRERICDLIIQEIGNNND